MYITSSDVTVRFLIQLLFISVLDWSTPRIPFEIECTIVKVGEESEHAESIESAINTEPVVGDLSASVSEDHEDGVKQLIELGEPVDLQAMPQQAFLLHTCQLLVWRDRDRKYKPLITQSHTYNPGPLADSMMMTRYRNVIKMVQQ